MKITVDKRSPEVLEALSSFSPDTADLGGMGTFWISTDDDAMIAVLVSYETNRLHELQSTLVAIKGMTDYVYLVTGQASNGQLLSMQELGIFTTTFGFLGDNYEALILNGLPRLVEFVANPKRRKEKKIQSIRNVRVFSPGEQILLVIDGIGPAKVGALINHFGGVDWAIAAMTWFDTADTLDGVITPTMISNFREALGLKDNEVLSVVVNE